MTVVVSFTWNEAIALLEPHNTMDRASWLVMQAVIKAQDIVRDSVSLRAASRDYLLRLARKKFTDPPNVTADGEGLYCHFETDAEAVEFKLRH